jgi:nucleoside phosphorylase
VNMDEIVTLSDEPLPETQATITCDIFSEAAEDDRTIHRREGLPQKKELEGKITLNPERCLIYSLPPTAYSTAQVIAPDSTQWDMYLIIIPFTLHRPPEDRHYEEMTFFVEMADQSVTAFDLFPRDVSASIEEEGMYTLSPQLTVIPADANMRTGGKQIRFPPLYPIITAFGKNESTFFWTYEKSPAQQRVAPGTKNVLAILQVPRQTGMIEAKISYEMVVVKHLPGKWRYTDAASHKYYIRWDLSQAQQFYEPLAARTVDADQQFYGKNNAQLPVRKEQTPQEAAPTENALFDVCVICALAEEARAFMQEAARLCGVQFQRTFDKEHKIDYYHTRIQNTLGEPLTIHVSYSPDTGPLEAALHLKPLLKKFRPRFAAMTGICAGDKRRVKLGDLIVADRAYVYDSGKFIIDEYGKRKQLHEADVYHVSPKIRNFIGMFEQWKSLVEPPEPACYIGAMASGNAVRDDNLFDEAQFPVRDTLAIDMEGAAFYRTVEDFPEMSALLVKGVSDYADGQKDDSFHERAATVSATYILAFIQQYVTADRMPHIQAQEL